MLNQQLMLAIYLKWFRLKVIIVLFFGLVTAEKSHAIIHHFKDESSLKWARNSKFSAVGELGFISKLGTKSQSTGVLITPSIVLTCGHCVGSSPGERMFGWFTLDPDGLKGDLDESVSLRLVGDVKVHDSLTRDEDGYFIGTDLALVKLMRPLSTSPAALFDGDPRSFFGKNAYVVGYGQAGQGSDLKRTSDARRRMAIVPVSRVEEKIMFIYGLLSNHPFHFSRDEKNPHLGVPTYGDSGGPLFVGSTENIRIGGIYHGVIVTEVFGAHIAQALWSNVSADLEWIRKGVSELTHSGESVAYGH